MMRHLILTLLLAVSAGLLFAQIPPGYYDPAVGLHGEELQNALHGIIDGHQVETYDELWTDFETTDQKQNGKVWDIYSDIPGGTPPYEYTFFSDQCDSYSGEGDCYNREHSFPKSWFGGTVYPMYTDLFHIYPTDGFVNGMRGNYPYGEVASPTWTSLNGSMLGACSASGYAGTVFEPVETYKGDLARTCFYMATRYYGEDASWPGSDMTSGAQPKSWALDMLYTWHLSDPVSGKEVDRNNAVFAIQGNRNPFIDHPEFVEEIWFYAGMGVKKRFPFSMKTYPVPFLHELCIELPLQVTGNWVHCRMSDILGHIVLDEEIMVNGTVHLDTEDLGKGFYTLNIYLPEKQHGITAKVVKTSH